MGLTLWMDIPQRSESMDDSMLSSWLQMVHAEVGQVHRNGQAAVARSAVLLSWSVHGMLLELPVVSVCALGLSMWPHCHLALVQGALPQGT